VEPNVNWKPTLAALALCMLGCRSNLNRFDQHGFRSTLNPYGVRYADPVSGHLISADWHVANFQYRDGRPTESLHGESFESELEWHYGDGAKHVVAIETFDLLLEHNTNAAIWVRVVPIPQGLYHKKVQFLAENYVNNFSGSYDSQLGGTMVARRLATQILKSESAGFRGRPAHVVTFDYVSLDQLELDANAPRTRARIVLVAIWFRKVLIGGGTSGDFEVPGYLMIGYANDAAHFNALAPTFDAFLKQVAIGKAAE
jgi:hypothetical protein